MSKIAEAVAQATAVTRQTVIQLGHVYRGKYPRLTSHGEVNDREVTYVGHSGVQFASPSDEGHCIYVTHAQFRDWARHDVTALYEGRETWHGPDDLKAWIGRSQTICDEAA